MSIRVWIYSSNILLLCCCWVCYTAYSQAIFEWVEEREGVRIYQYYEKQTRLLWTRGVVQLRVAPEQVIALLQNSQLGPRWINEVRYMETLVTYSPQHWISRSIIHFPFPYKDRELILENRLRKPNQHHWILEQKVADWYSHEKNNFVSVKTAYGIWNLHVKDLTYTEVIYTFAADVNTSLPQAIEKKLAAMAMQATLRRMRRLLEGDLASSE